MLGKKVQLHKFCFVKILKNLLKCSKKLVGFSQKPDTSGIWQKPADWEKPVGTLIKTHLKTSILYVCDDFKVQRFSISVKRAILVQLSLYLATQCSLRGNS